MSTATSTTEELVNREYRYGFVTDIETDTVPRGLNEDIIRLISAKKNEPNFHAGLAHQGLPALGEAGKSQAEPKWANVHYPPIDYQDLIYYSAPKTSAEGLKSLDEVDPKLLETYAKLGIPLSEQKWLSGVAVDAVFDSVSVATTFKEKLAELGIIFRPFSEAVQKHADLSEKVSWVGGALQ